MRNSGTLINLAAAAALAFAAGSLWHAYKVRFADETEHSASTEAGSGEAGAPAPASASEPEQKAASPAEVPPTPVATSRVPPATAVTVPVQAEAAPTAPLPAARAPTIETVQPVATPAPALARISLRDPRELPATFSAPEVVAPLATSPLATSPFAPFPFATGARAPDKPSSAQPVLSDRRSLTGSSATAAPALAGDTAIRNNISALRDPRPIIALQIPDARAPNGNANEPPIRQAPASIETQSTSAGTATSPPVAVCGPHILATEARDGGIMRLVFTSSCRANQDVQLAYGGAVLIRRLDQNGRLDVMLDAFAGAGSDVVLTFADGNTEKRPVVAKDLDKLTKVAVIWSAPINLDLHAFEYSASYGKAGHVWERAASTLVSAREIAAGGRRGRGYLSTSDDGRSLGDKLEVYTFLHHDEQASGVVAMGLDYETRGEIPAGMTCGNGAFAEVRYHVVTLDRRGQTARENGILSPAPCGAKIGTQVRFDPFLLPAIRVQK